MRLKRLDFRSEQLLSVQIGVGAVLPEELLVRAALYDLAFVQYGDEVCTITDVIA